MEFDDVSRFVVDSGMLMVKAGVVLGVSKAVSEALRAH